MKRLLLALFLTLPVFAATISGTITPAGAFTVQAYDASGVLRASTTADASGHYTLTVNPGHFRVLAFDPAGVYATSFYPDAESFETSALLDVKSTVSNINFPMLRAGAIAGSVTPPVGAITIAAYNPDGTRRGFTTSDATGHYQLVLPPGTYRLAAYDEAQHYLTAFLPATVTIAAGQTLTGNFVLPPAAKVSGVVTSSSGAAIGNAVIAFYAGDALAFYATTDASGAYSIAAQPGSYRVVVYDPAGVYAPLYAPGAASFAASPIYVFNGGDTRTLDAQLAVAAHIAVHVTDSTSGAALAGMTVAAYNPDGSVRAFATTDGGGNATLVVPPGTYRVGAYDTALAYLQRFYPNERTFAAATPVSAFASQTTSLSIALPRGASVSGQVTTSTLASISGMTVAAYDANGVVAQTTTDDAGRYRLLLEPGSYTIAAFDPRFHYATVYARLAVAMGQALDGVNFTLVDGAHVSGIATSESGAPLAGVTIAAYGDVTTSTTTSSSGTFDLMLPPGTYRFEAYPAPSGPYIATPLTQPYTLVAGQPVGITFRLAAAAFARRRSAAH